MRKIFILFFYFLILFPGWSHRSDYFPIISDVFKNDNKLYFLIKDKYNTYIIEKVKNYIFEYILESKDSIYLGKDILKKIKDIETEKEICWKKEYEGIRKEIKVNKKLSIRVMENFFELIYSEKVDTYPLPPLTFNSFKRLKKDFEKYVNKCYGSYENFINDVKFNYSIKDCFLIKDKIWFTITFYSGEDCEGIGGIGYFNIKKKELGIARIPELIDYSCAAAMNFGNSIFISSKIIGESGDKYNNFLIEFNTEDCSYRIYSWENTAFRNFGINKIEKIGKDTLVFYTGNEVVLFDIENDYWERYTIFVRTKEDSAPIYYLKKLEDDEKGKEWKKISTTHICWVVDSEIVRYARKRKEFYPVYFTIYDDVEIETNFPLCGTINYKVGLFQLNYIDKSPIWNLLEIPSVINHNNAPYVFFASPLMDSNKISKKLSEVCILGAYIERKNVEITIKKTKEGRFEKPEWKNFSDNPFFEMEEEVKRMKKE